MTQTQLTIRAYEDKDQDDLIALYQLAFPNDPPWNDPSDMIACKKAIDAVLNAEDHNYYFMCAKPDNSGLHNFAATLSEHNRNARLFHAYMDSRGL